MKTLDFDAGPDEVLGETIDPETGEPMIRVRRKVAVLGGPYTAKRISTVSSPANLTPFASVKSTPEESAVTEPTRTEAQKASLFDRIVSVLSGQGQLVEEPAAAQKQVDGAISVASAKPVPDVASSFAAAEFENDWYDLKWALQTAVWDVLFYDAFEGERVAALQAVMASFNEGVVRLIAKAQAAGLKSVELPSMKAGKVLSKTNLANLQKASDAIQAILAKANPPVVETDSEKAFDPEDLKKEKADGEKADGETDKEDGDMDDMDAEKNPEALKGAEEPSMKEEKAAALKALEAVKAAKTDEERAEAMKAMELALRGEEAPVTKSAVEKMIADAVANALKVIPGLPIEGDMSEVKDMTAKVNSPAVDPAAQGAVIFPAGRGPQPVDPLGGGRLVGAPTMEPQKITAAKSADQRLAELEQKFARLSGAQPPAAQQPNGQAAVKSHHAALDAFIGYSRN